MKGEVVQISWHTKEPVFSVDFHSSGRLVTGGGDNAVRIWSILEDNKVKLLSSLLRHLAPVNCVRFSPDGKLLASGSDDGFVILWRLDETAAPSAPTMDNTDAEPNLEEWTVVKSIHANKKDIYDISWAYDSSLFMTGSTDNAAAIWKINSGQPVTTFNDHIHFVQGVAWDPLGKFVVSQSSDRTVRIYKRKTPKSKDFSTFRILKYLDTDSVGKGDEMSDIEEESSVSSKKQRLFSSDSVGSFFRRAAWSPDGALLFTPCGIWQASPEEAISYTTFAWSRHDFTKPITHLPCGIEPSFVVRFHPQFFQLRRNEAGEVSPVPWFQLEYRMIFAVGTKSEVILYDTQHVSAIGTISRYHLASITDLAWSHNGKHLVVSSRDAFCSVISFAENELGLLYDQPNVNEVQTAT